jgi:exodeoxyribonuclease-5
MNDIIFSPSQQAVVNAFPGFLMDDTKEFTITGFAGSGKTFIVQYLADMTAKHEELIMLIDPTVPHRQCLFTATTNKAAAVLQEMLQQEVTTIHSLLGLTVVNNYKTGKVTLTKKHSGKPLRNTVLFIDEASMINAELLRIIREDTKSIPGCKVVYIGDSYQLPPVMEDVCPVFQERPNTHFLNEIQRQVEGSPIIQLSAQYREVLDNHELDWPNVPTNTAITHYDNKRTFFDAIEKRFKESHEPNDYKVVAWSNKRVRDYNTWIRTFSGFTELYECGEVIVTNKPLFVDGSIVAATDSMHIIRSSSPAVVDDIQGYQIELIGIAGDFFQPTDWEQADALSKVYAKEAKKTRQWQPYFAIKQDWSDLRPIHASTVHKAQGSTYKEVFVDLSNIGKNNKWREVARLVYVAITRASDHVHIFGAITGNYNKQPIVDLMEPFRNGPII